MTLLRYFVILAMIFSSAKTINLLINECLNGALLEGGKCLCIAGFTGEKCDVGLYDKIIQEIGEEKQSHFPMLDNDKTVVIRLKRENNEDEMDGQSGGSAEEAVICPAGQARAGSHNDSHCVDVYTFLVQIDTNVENVTLGSLEKEIRESLGSHMDIVSVEFASNLTYIANKDEATLNGIIHFNYSQSDLTIPKVEEILSERLIQSNLLSGNVSAKDVNECDSEEDLNAQKNACDGPNNRCINNNGSFECVCADEYVDDTPSNTRVTQNRVCSKCKCENSGVCYKGPSSETLCRCPTEYSGDNCEYWVILPWYQATIALGVICSFLLLVFIVLIIVYVMKRKEARSGDISVHAIEATGYRNPAHEEATTNFGASEETNGENASKPVDDAEKGQVTTSTFKPQQTQQDDS